MVRLGQGVPRSPFSLKQNCGVSSGLFEGCDISSKDLDGNPGLSSVSLANAQNGNTGMKL